MFKKDQDIVVAHCDEQAVRVVHVRSSATEQKVIDVAQRDARETPPEDLSKLVASAFEELHCKKIRTICLVPSKSVITKNIEIPSLDPQEIRSIIDLQAGRHTPYSREDIIVGYVSIGTFQRNYTKVLLTIVNRDIIKKQMALYEDAGARIDKIIFAPEAMALFYAQGMHIKTDDVPVGIINVAKNSTDFTVEFNQTVATYRNIPIGMTHLIKDGTDAQPKLLAELTKSLEVYQNEDINKLPETFVLTSDDAKLKELQPVLQEQLKANVKVVPYLDWIKANQPVMLKFVSEYNDESFLDCIAGAAACDKLQVDLTPDEIKTQRAIEEKGRQVISTGVLAVLLLLMFCGVFFSKLYFQSVHLSKVKERYIKERRSVEILDRVARKTRILKDYINSRMIDLDVIEEMYHLIPEEIYLESILMDEEGVIQIQGVSESMSRVFNFVSALEESELFKRVKTKSTTAKKERGKDVAAFEIMFMLESAKESAMKEEVVEEEVPEAAPTKG